MLKLAVSFKRKKDLILFPNFWYRKAFLLLIWILLSSVCPALGYYATHFSQSNSTTGWVGSFGNPTSGTITLGWGSGGYSGEDCLYVYVNKTSTTNDSALIYYQGPPFVLGTDTVWSIYACSTTTAQPPYLWVQLFSQQGAGWLWANPGYDSATAGSGPPLYGFGGNISTTWQQFTFYRNDTTLGTPMDLIGIQFVLSNLTGRFVFKMDNATFGPNLSPIPLVITSTTIPNGIKNIPYSLSLKANGGISPYNWSVLSGNLPPGFSLTSMGIISGIPSTTGNYNFTIQISDCLSSTQTQLESFYISNTTFWNLVWSDEFNYTGPPDSSKWTYNLGYLGWNQETEYYTNLPENVWVDNGNLIITALNTSYMGYQYTSAFLKTYGIAYWTYGRFEMRAKLPTGNGMWPAFWLLGENDTYGPGWPYNGEIDIMENVGWNPDATYGSVHSGTIVNNYASINQSKTLIIPGVETSFHVYALEWYPGVLYWYVDSTLYATYTSNNTGYQQWPFDEPFYILVNLAIGGWGTNYGQYPMDNSNFPQQMLVDYVRVYQASPSTMDVHDWKQMDKLWKKDWELFDIQN